MSYDRFYLSSLNVLFSVDYCYLVWIVGSQQYVCSIFALMIDYDKWVLFLKSHKLENFKSFVYCLIWDSGSSVVLQVHMDTTACTFLIRCDIVGKYEWFPSCCPCRKGSGSKANIQRGKESL